jgi:DNA-binding MarR family transcriptional regulator
VSDASTQVAPHPLSDLDTIIHAPARLMLLTILYVVEAADFALLANQAGLSSGNLSTHLSKLEEAEYVEIEKSFRGKRPHTMIRLTESGREAFRRYREQMQQALGALPE